MKNCTFIRFYLLFIILFFSAGVVFADDKSLKVGFILPLSGNIAASMGEAFQRGVTMYQEDNKSFADNVSFIYEDHAYDSKRALSAFHKLSSTDKVDLIVIWGNTPSSSVAPVAEQMKVPVLAVSMNPDGLGRDYVMTIGPKLETLIDKVVEQFRQWKLAGPAAISLDLGSALPAIDMLKEKLDNKLTVEIVAGGEADFKTMIIKLKKKKVDGMLLFLLPAQALTFLRQATELNYAPKIIGGDVFAEDEFNRSARKFLPEVHYVYGAVEESFINQMISRWNSKSYFYETATAYSIATFLDRIGEEKRAGKLKAGILKRMLKAETLVSPIDGLQVVNNDEYGEHFMNNALIYGYKD